MVFWVLKANQVGYEDWFYLSWVSAMSKYKRYQDPHTDHSVLLDCKHLNLDDLAMSESDNSPQGNVRMPSLRNVSKC